MKELWPADPLALKVVPPQTAEEGKAYKLSQFAFPFEVCGRTFLFNALTRQCLDMEGQDVPGAPFVFAGKDKGSPAEALIKTCFLVSEDRDECAVYEGAIRVLRIIRKKPGYGVYTILPTTSCNARCVYCFEEGMEHITMTPQTVDKVIAFIIATHGTKQPVKITWFGGEPLLCRDIISSISAGLTDAGIAFESTMITNGSLIDGKTADLMTGLWNLKSIQLSMDCAEKEYIRRKNYYSYHDEYHSVIRAAGELAKRGIKVVVRCNVDEGNMGDMEEFVRDLDDAITDRENVSVYFLPLYEVQALKTGSSVWAACTAGERLLRDRGFKTRSGLRVRRLKTVYCMAEEPDNSVVIAPDGTLYNCEHCLESGVLGNVREGITNKAFIEELGDPEPAEEKCRTCTFLPECMTFSGCPVRKAVCKDQQSAWLTEALKIEVMERISGTGRDSAADENGNGIIC